jgi:hypothetical protein
VTGVVWHHDGSIDNRSSHSTVDDYGIKAILNISFVTTFDEGIYNCSAQNIRSSNYIIVELHISYPPSVIRTTNDSVVVNASDTIALSCLMTGKPLPHVVWTFTNESSNDIVLTDHDIRNIIRNDTTLISILTLHNTTTTRNEGVYKCTGSNGIQNLINATNYSFITLIVQTRPNVLPLNATLQIDALPNETIKLSFMISHASPLVLPADIKWTLLQSNKTIIDLTNDPNVVFSPDWLSLTIVSMTTKYAGIYSFEATNPAGSSSGHYRINIGSKPSVIMSPHHLTVSMGTLLVLITCHDTVTHPISNLSWFFNEIKVANSSKYAITHHMNGSSILMIRDLNVSDDGVYTCQANNILGSSTEGVTLTIHVRPSVYNTSTCSLPATVHVNKDQDDSLLIECVADGIPLPSMAWYKDRRAIINNDRITIMTLNVSVSSACRHGVPAVRSILHITSLKQPDDGMYLCEVTDGYHSPITVDTIVSVKPKYVNYCHPNPCQNGGNCTNAYNSFTCHCADTFTGITCQEVSFNPSIPRIIDVSPSIYQSLSSNVTLRCIVSGYPQPDVTWYKDGVILEGVKSQLYHIEHLTLESRGLYQCKATNELGSDESDRFYVKIRGLIQYRADLTFNRQFIIQEILFDKSRNKRQNEYNFTATEESLNRIIDLVNRETRNRLSSPGFTYFDMELLPINIISLLQPIPMLLTLLSDNSNSQMIKTIITQTLANITQFISESSMLTNPVNISYIKRFDGCPFEISTYPPPDGYHNNELDFVFEWAETDISQTLTLKCPCGPEGFDIGSKVPRNASRKCIGNFNNGAIWAEPDYTGCSNFTSNTRRLCNLALLDEPGEIMNGLYNITSHYTRINSLDVIISTTFVENTAPNATGNASLSDVYLNVIDNLISTNESSMTDSNEETKSSGRLLYSFESVINEYPLNDTITTISLSQYTVILRNVSFNVNDEDNIAIGLIDDFNASIYLPSSILDNVSLPHSSVRLIQAFFMNDLLFLRRRSLLETKGYLKVGSVLVSASMYNQSISGLTNNLINITFRMDQDIRMNARDLMCSYWEPKGDDNYGDWMIDGCGLLTNTTEYAVCGCNHLTTFALLMDVSPIPVTNPPGYNEFIMSTSYIGCIVSIICICALILTYSIERKLRSTTNGKLLLNLLIAFLGLYLSFISSVLLMSIIPLCIISSAVSQYFVLASCLAMAGEATVLYHKLVKVFSQVNERIVKMIFIVTWVLPIFIVIFTLAPNYQTYINSQFCRAVDYQFWIGYATPVVIILLYNAIMFVIIAFAVFKHQRTTTKNINGKLMTLLTISLLFGLNWVFAFASTQSLPVQWLRLSFQILFVLLGGFHGFYLFILYGLRLPKVRSVWLKWFYILTNQRDKANAVDKNMDKILFSQNSMRNSRLMKVFERTTSLNKQSKSNLDLPAEDVCNSKKQVNICTNDGSTHEKINNNTSSVTTDTNNNGNDDAANQPNSNDAGIGISEEKIDTVTDTMTDTISDYSSCYYSDLQPEPV